VRLREPPSFCRVGHYLDVVAASGGPRTPEQCASENRTKLRDPGRIDFSRALSLSRRSPKDDRDDDQLDVVSRGRDCRRAHSATTKSSTRAPSPSRWAVWDDRDYQPFRPTAECGTPRVR
jgi:hypothetical protein